MARFLQSGGWKWPLIVALVLTVLSQLVEENQRRGRAFPADQATTVALNVSAPNAR